MRHTALSLAHPSTPYKTHRSACRRLTTAAPGGAALRQAGAARTRGGTGACGAAEEQVAPLATRHRAAAADIERVVREGCAWTWREREAIDPEVGVILGRGEKTA